MAAAAILDLQKTAQDFSCQTKLILYTIGTFNKHKHETAVISKRDLGYGMAYALYGMARNKALLKCNKLNKTDVILYFEILYKC